MTDIVPDAYATALAEIADRAGAVDDAGATLDFEIDRLHAAGALLAALPASLGGRTTWADDPIAVTTLLRAVGRASLPVGRLFEGHVNAAQLVALYGSAALAGRVRSAVAAGALLGVWGADGDTPLTAAAAADGFVLAGAKDFCSGLGTVRIAIVSAAVPGGTQLVAVDVDDPARADPARWQMAGMRATASGSFDFTGLQVAADAALGPVDGYYREPYFLGGMYRMCAVQVGGMEALLAAVITLLHQRGQADNALQLHRLGKAATQLQMARAVVEQLAVAVAHDDGDVTVRAILMREAVETCATALLQLTERAAGTAAHRRGGDLERIRRDLGLYLRQAAVDERLGIAGGQLAARPQLLLG